MCRSAFDSRGRVTCSYEQVGFEPSKLIAKYTYIEIESVLITTIWLPHGHTQKQKDHEEGHRRIAERVYVENSERIARQVAAKYIGKTIRKFLLYEEHKKLATVATKKAGMEISVQWLKQIVEISKRLNESYDVITDHGRNDIAEDEAIELAFAKDDNNGALQRPVASRKSKRFGH